MSSTPPMMTFAARMTRFVPEMLPTPRKPARLPSEPTTALLTVFWAFAFAWLLLVVGAVVWWAVAYFWAAATAWASVSLSGMPRLTSACPGTT